MTRFYRRAVGFEIRVHTARADEALVAAEGRSPMVMSRDRLREWMSLDRFREDPLPEHVLQQLEAHDLVYYCDHAAERATTGAPLAARSGAVALRGSVKVVPLVSDATGVIQRLPFMPRSLAGFRLAALRFESLEMGECAYAVVMSGEVARLRALVPLLNGSRAPESLQPEEALLGLLDDCGLLTNEVPALLPAGDVCWLGHAGVVVSLGATCIYVDPLLAASPEPRRTKAMPDWRTLPAPDAIAITHADHDHLNPSSLLLLPPHTPIIFPKAPKEPYQVDAEALLQLLGFSDITLLDTWQTRTIGDTQLTATPFAGEDWGLTLAQSTYVIAGPRGTIYCAADSRNDATALARIAREHTIELAFLGVSGSAEPLIPNARFGYTFYKDVLDPKRRNAWQEHCAGPQEAARAAALLGAREVFGYAAGGGAFTKLAFSDRGSHAELTQILSTLPQPPRARELPLGVPVRLRD